MTEQETPEAHERSDRERGGDAPESRRAGATKPGWLPFSAVLAVLTVLVAVPVSLTVLAPERAEGTVGVYERVSLLESAAPGTTVLAGFIAPEGWLRATDDGSDDEGSGRGEESEDAGSTPAGFSTQNGDAWLEATAHAGVTSANSLLRESVPAGAALSPIRTLSIADGFDTRMIEYDLDAGAGFVQSFAVCNTNEKRGCLLFELQLLDPRTEPGEVRPDIAAVLRSAEVY